MTKNEAADNLRRFMESDGWEHGTTLLDDALAAQHRLTVKAIRERLADNHNTFGAEVYRLDQIELLLDEVADRP